MHTAQAEASQLTVGISEYHTPNFLHTYFYDKLDFQLQLVFFHVLVSNELNNRQSITYFKNSTSNKKLDFFYQVLGRICEYTKLL